MTALLHRPPLTVSASAAQGSPTPCDLHHIASTRTHRVSPVLPVCAASPLLSPPHPLSVCVLLTAGTRRTPLGGHMLHPYAFLQPPHSKPPFNLHSSSLLRRSSPSLSSPLLFFIAPSPSSLSPFSPPDRLHHVTAMAATSFRPLHLHSIDGSV